MIDQNNNISEDLLKQVNGGGSGESGGEDDRSDPGSGNGGMIIDTTTAYCHHCKDITVFNICTGGRIICTECNVRADQ